MALISKNDVLPLSIKQIGFGHCQVIDARHSLVHTIQGDLDRERWDIILAALDTHAPALPRGVPDFHGSDEVVTQVSDVRLPKWSDEQIARLFHEAYERLAPDYNYKTRTASAVPWDDVPENNRKLMIAVASEVRHSLSTEPQPTGDIAELLEDLVFDLHPIGKPVTEHEKGFHEGAKACIRAVTEKQTQLRTAVAELQRERELGDEAEYLIEKFRAGYVLVDREEIPMSFQSLGKELNRTQRDVAMFQASNSKIQWELEKLQRDSERLEEVITLGLYLYESTKADGTTIYKIKQMPTALPRSIQTFNHQDWHTDWRDAIDDATK